MTQIRLISNETTIYKTDKKRYRNVFAFHCAIFILEWVKRWICRPQTIKPIPMQKLSGYSLLARTFSGVFLGVFSVGFSRFSSLALYFFFFFGNYV